MKKTALATLVAAATVALGGVAVAQAQDWITSTPGAGATATCNTLRGGTGAHRPDPNACRPRVPAQAAMIEKVQEPVALAEPEPIPAAPAVTEMGAPPAPEQPAPMLPARADRG